MAKLISVSNVSLDGFIEDEHGGFEWTAPSDGDDPGLPPRLPPVRRDTAVARAQRIGQNTDQ